MIMKKKCANSNLKPSVIRALVSTLFFLLFLVVTSFSLSPNLVFAETPNPDETAQAASTGDQKEDAQEFSCLPLYQVPLALNPHDHFYFIRPIAVDSNTDPSPDFRYGYYYPSDSMAHTGVDIISPLHKPVLAAGDGTVVFTGYGLMNGGGDENDPYGLSVLIKHNFNFQDKTIYTVYAHLDRIDVEEDQFIHAGDPIGIIGMTGNTSGPHVHFEVRIEDSKGGRVQNPELWMAPPIGSGVLVGRLIDNYGYLIASQELIIKSLESDDVYHINSYAPEKSIYSDDYYKENFVIGDIPAGNYELSMLYKNRWNRIKITIAPGAVNYVIFDGKNGFSQQFPNSPDPAEFLY